MTRHQDMWIRVLLVCLLAVALGCVVDGLNIHSIEKKLNGQLEPIHGSDHGPSPHGFIQTDASSEVNSGSNAGVSSAAPNLNKIERSVFNWWKTVGNGGAAPVLSQTGALVADLVFPLSSGADLDAWAGAVGSPLLTIHGTLNTWFNAGPNGSRKKGECDTKCGTIADADEKAYCLNFYCPVKAAHWAVKPDQIAKYWTRINKIRANVKIGNSIFVAAKVPEKQQPTNEARWHYLEYVFRRQTATNTLGDNDVPCHFMMFAHVYEGDFANENHLVGVWDEGGAHYIPKLLERISTDKWPGLRATRAALKTDTAACNALTNVRRGIIPFQTTQYTPAACWTALYDARAPTDPASTFATAGSGGFMYRLLTMHQSTASGVVQLNYDKSQPHDYMHYIARNPPDREHSFATMFPVAVDTPQKLLDVLQQVKDRQLAIAGGSPLTTGEHVQPVGLNGQDYIVKVTINALPVLVTCRITTAPLVNPVTTQLSYYGMGYYGSVFPITAEAQLPVPVLPTLPTYSRNFPANYGGHNIVRTYAQAIAARNIAQAASNGYANNLLNIANPSPAYTTVSGLKLVQDNLINTLNNSPALQAPKYYEGTAGNQPTIVQGVTDITTTYPDQVAVTAARNTFPTDEEYFRRA